MSKLLTVFGATGLQGGSLLYYLLKRPDVLEIYRLRGITRDVTKPEAQKLKDVGVEVVAGDMDDESSLRTAISGSSVVFAMTNFWEKGSAEVEIAQGKAIADAAVAAGAEFIIWASLPNVTAMTNGKITAWKHFDSKAEVEAYIRGLPIKSAFFLPAMYMQMMTHMFRPKPNNKGELTFSVRWSEDDSCPLIDITNTGMFLVPVLLHLDKYDKKRFVAATGFYTPAEMIEGWKKITGKEMKYNQAGVGSIGLPPEVVKMFIEGAGLINDYEYYGPTGRKDLEWTLAQMDDKPTTWESFVTANEPWF